MRQRPELGKQLEGRGDKEYDGLDRLTGLVVKHARLLRQAAQLQDRNLNEDRVGVKATALGRNVSRSHAERGEAQGQASWQPDRSKKCSRAVRQWPRHYQIETGTQRIRLQRPPLATGQVGEILNAISGAGGAREA